MISTLPLTPADVMTAQSAQAGSPWIGRAIWLLLALLLCVANILTLLDRDFRNSAYEVVSRLAARSVLEPIGLSRVAEFVEAGNPVALEKLAIARATQHLVEGNALQQREIASLKHQRLALAMDRLHLQKQLSDSRAAMALHKNRASDLGRRVLGRAAKSVTRHLASLPGHALPVLSATVAVGSVALDIRDACESLEELDALNWSVGLPPVNRASVCGTAVPTAAELLANARDNWKRVYATSAQAINAGAEIIPWSPPSISFQAAQKWLVDTIKP